MIQQVAEVFGRDSVRRAGVPSHCRNSDDLAGDV